MDSTFERLKELDLSRDEVDRIGDALKKPEFRKLLSDYVEEIQDPKNKELYEQEITQLEKERGNDITFIHPKPSYVIKTSVDGQRKAFINICVNDIIKKPTSKPTVKEGEKGLTWSLPHSLSPPREDFDNKRMRCKVYDVVFHPDTLHLASRNKSFRDVVNMTALEAVENNFGVTLDKKNLKFPKLSYKGLSHASVIRTPSKIKPEHSPEDKEILDKIFSAYDVNTKSKSSPKKVIKVKQVDEDEKSKYTIPTYIIKHRSHVDFEEFTEHKRAKLNAAIPKELIVEVNVPLLKSSADIVLDVAEKTVQLISEKPAKYKLNLTLPYAVNESCGNAKFDKDKKKLVITLPVKRTTSTLIDFSDSGVESDACSPGTPESEDEPSEKQSVKEFAPSEPSEKFLEKPVDFRTNFLEENFHYNLPEFTCHVFENTIAFTLNVKNVDGNSIAKAFFDEDSSLHIKFTTISSSFYPTHYAFFVNLPQYKIDENNTTVEVWDNNIILQLPVFCDNPITSYYYGIHESDIKEKYVEEPQIINQILQQNQENSVINEVTVKDVISKETTVTENINIIQTPPQQSKENRKDSFDEIDTKSTRAIDIAGTSYESSGDELSSCSYSPSKSKGILKRISSGRCSVGRSISESSLDNFVFSSVENCYTSLDSVIPEDGEVSSSEKKTVRFNDVVMSQLFRSNSSILGQKKKNQRRARNKKRALERRCSESEASGDEKREGDTKDYNFKKEGQFEKKDDNIFHLEVDN